MFAQVDQLRDESGSVLQAILDQSQDCIKLISRDGLLEYMNRNGRQAMEIDDFSEVSGLCWSSLWPEETRDLVEAAVARALEGRKSRFDAFCPTAKGEPRWWDVSVSPIRDTKGHIGHVLATSRDISVQKAERQSERERRERAEQHADFRDIVSREMRHRLKNVLGIVASLARLTGRQTETVAAFLPTFEARIDNLSRAQILLSESESHRATLAVLVPLLLGGATGDQRISVSAIPAANLDDRASQVVSLVIGELMTNACKYGALACHGGQVGLNIKVADGAAWFTWTETCDTPVDEPTRRGSGSVLMQRMTAGQPQPMSLEWLPTGLVARFAVPVD